MTSDLKRIYGLARLKPLQKKTGLIGIISRRFNHFLKEAGGAGRNDIKTYFDLIEFDEGRLK